MSAPFIQNYRSSSQWYGSLTRRYWLGGMVILPETSLFLLFFASSSFSLCLHLVAFGGEKHSHTEPDLICTGPDVYQRFRCRFAWKSTGPILYSSPKKLPVEEKTSGPRAISPVVRQAEISTAHIHGLFGPEYI